MDLGSLIHRLDARPTPALISFAGGERLELTGKVCANWIIKIANLVGETGSGLLLDLPLHWRSVFWCAGAWLAASPVYYGTGGNDNFSEDVALAVTHLAETAARWEESTVADVVMVQALPALALQYPGKVPLGVTDATSEIRSQPDALIWAESPDPTATLFPGGPTWAQLGSQLQRAVATPTTGEYHLTSQDVLGGALESLFALARGQIVVIPADPN
ncbi:MAG: TIGR03089 family protein [Actinomycetaceae bacterium]|nr:TIGR03089 family protein [Actinomycetaceae bacterium]